MDKEEDIRAKQHKIPRDGRRFFTRTQRRNDWEHRLHGTPIILVAPWRAQAAVPAVVAMRGCILLWWKRMMVSGGKSRGLRTQKQINTNRHTPKYINASTHTQITYTSSYLSIYQYIHTSIYQTNTHLCLTGAPHSYHEVFTFTQAWAKTVGIDEHNRLRPHLLRNFDSKCQIVLSWHTHMHSCSHTYIFKYMYVFIH